MIEECFFLHIWHKHVSSRGRPCWHFLGGTSQRTLDRVTEQSTSWPGFWGQIKYTQTQNKIFTRRRYLASVAAAEDTLFAQIHTQAESRHEAPPGEEKLIMQSVLLHAPHRTHPGLEEEQNWFCFAFQARARFSFAQLYNFSFRAPSYMECI